MKGFRVEEVTTPTVRNGALSVNRHYTVCFRRRKFVVMSLKNVERIRTALQQGHTVSVRGHHVPHVLVDGAWKSIQVGGGGAREAPACLPACLETGV